MRLTVLLLVAVVTVALLLYAALAGNEHEDED